MLYTTISLYTLLWDPYHTPQPLYSTNASIYVIHHNLFGGSVGCASDWWSGGSGFDPRQIGNILSWRTDHEIISMVILSFPLIQEGQLSVSGERMCTILVNPLED